MCGTTRTPHWYFPWRLDRPTHKSCQSTLFLFFILQSFWCKNLARDPLSPRLRGQAWAGVTQLHHSSAPLFVLHLCAVCRHAPDARSAPAIFGLRLATAVTCHTGDTHTAHFGRLSALLLASCLDFRLKQGRKKKKELHTHTYKLPNPHTFAHYGWE